MIRTFTFPTHVYSSIIAVLLCMSLVSETYSQPTLALSSPVISSGLSAPIQFVNAGDGSGRVFIVQQAGTIRVYDAGFNYLGDFLTVSNINAGGERGLLSMVFHPQYASNGFFYVYYNNTNGDLELARYQVSADPNIANSASKRILITIPHPNFTNHNGGELHFGNDGYLYLSTGDGGSGGDPNNNAQNTSVLLGKILRFNVNTSNTAPYYTIPAGNPYGNEVFALGLRNPFRWSFDRLNYDMWIGDVGQDNFEEIDHRTNATMLNANYGWRCYEGLNSYNSTGCGPASNYVFPVRAYPTQNPSAAVTGGVVYRGSIFPGMQGYYIATDFFSGRFYTVRQNGSGYDTSSQVLNPPVTGIADFGETEDGEVYLVSLTDGTVSHLLETGTGPVPVTLVNFDGIIENAGVQLSWRTSMEQNLGHFEIEYSTDGTIFTNLANVAAQNASTGYSYSYLDALHHDGVIFYRLKMVNTDGSYRYSGTIRLLLSDSKNIIAPTMITDGLMHVNLSSAIYDYVELISMDGKMILKENIRGRTGDIKIPVSKLATGMYVARLTGNSITTVEKVFIQQ